MRKTELDQIYEQRLTEREKKLLKFVNLEVSKTGYMPSVREIVRRTDVGSVGTVAGVFKRLEQKGFLRKITKKNSKNKYEIIKADDEENRKKRMAIAKKYRVLTVLVAKIPLIGKIKLKEEIFHEVNFEQYISVPEEYAKQENIYAFRSTNNIYKDKGILKDSIVIFDRQQKYIHLDIIAKYNPQRNIIRVDTYKRGDDETNILGKVIGSYTKITY